MPAALAPAETAPAVEAAEAVAPEAPALVAAAPVDLSSALEGSGLVMIETRADAMKAFQPEPPTEPVQPVRRRRAVAVVVDEPLIQVETGRK